MSAADELWSAVSDLFADNDGSLPEIEITGLSPEGAQAIFEELMRRGRPALPDPMVWDEATDKDVRIEDTPNAGLLAAQGRMRSLHFVLAGIEHEGVQLPDLGLSIYPEGVSLDYYMGPHWNAVTAAAFVDLLSELKQLGGGQDILVQPEGGKTSEADQQRFRDAMTRYSRTSP